MTKKQALQALASLTGGLFSLQAATAGHFLYHGRPRLAKAVMAGGLAADGLLLYSFLVPGARLTGSAFSRGNRNGNSIALTFDDGPRSPFTDRILDVLRDESVRATFFVLGDNARRHPGVLKRMEAEGHLVGNHGVNHDILMFASAHEGLAQILGCDAALREAGVRHPAPFFRAPHGWLSPMAYRAIGRNGYRVIGWTKGVWDTACPGVEVIESRTREVLQPGSILLLHDGWSGPSQEDRSQTALALPGIIRMARSMGLEFVTIKELIGGS